MTDQMGDLSYYYITFNSDGTGIFYCVDSDPGQPAERILQLSDGRGGSHAQCGYPD